VLSGTGDQMLDVVFESRGGKPRVVPMPFEGVLPVLYRRFREATGPGPNPYKDYFYEATCDACQGERLRPEARAVRLHTPEGAKTLPALSRLPLSELQEFFRRVTFEGNTAVIARDVLRE